MTMPLIYGLIASLVSLVPAFVAKILIALGIGVVSYVGVNALLGRITASVMSSAGSISGDVGVFLNLVGFDVCLGMVLSALAVKLALQTTNGVINKVSFTNKTLP